MAAAGTKSTGTTDPTSGPGPEIGLVVARYREDLSWLAAMGLPGVVYDKGGGASVPPGMELSPLPNVGREAYTYLTHIIERYQRLPAHTAFLQGNPFAHLAPPEEPRVTPEELGARLRALAASGRPFAGLAWFRLRCDGLGRPHDLADPAKKGRWKGWGKDIPVAAVHAALFGSAAPAEIIARAPTGNMLVSRERILARPLDFYRRALALVLADPEDEGNTGHALERLWQHVFGAAPGR